MEDLKEFRVTEHGGIDPQTESPRFVAKHLAAYEIASRFAEGQVLEIGFGDGYGSYLLSQKAREVTAIDLFQKNVDAAAAKYPKPHLHFMKMEATELALENERFDLVVSFQVIEHIPQGELGRYLDEIRRVLKPRGVACLTTLNLRKNKKPGQPYEKSPHHDKEFYPEEFEGLLKKHFQNVLLYGLYPSAKHQVFEKLKKSGILKGIPPAFNPVEQFYRGITVRDFRWLSRKNLDDSIDLLAMCRK